MILGLIYRFTLGLILEPRIAVQEIRHPKWGNIMRAYHGNRADILKSGPAIASMTDLETAKVSFIAGYTEFGSDSSEDHFARFSDVYCDISESNPQHAMMVFAQVVRYLSEDRKLAVKAYQTGVYNAKLVFQSSIDEVLAEYRAGMHRE